MRDHPYLKMPDHAFWRRAVTDVAPGHLDPFVAPPFRIDPEDRIATAGSCFAQHIGRRLPRLGLRYLVTERAHPLIPAEDARDLGYGLFTARYGNVYSSAQLLQLLRRAFGEFSPLDTIWHEDDGSVVDPFRPGIGDGGFGSEEELDSDRETHFEAVRRAFEAMDVFVFTLGLTEAWRDRRDGAVYPVCPGTKGGRFDPEVHEFVNFDVEDVVRDMGAFVAALRRRNPKVRILLTVSPVPLVATGIDRHVLVSTMASKAVLRVACEKLVRSDPLIGYFPSYEIIMGGFGATQYFEPDRRSISEAGIDHVMSVFAKGFSCATGDGEEHAATETGDEDVMRRAEHAIAVMCDEEALDPLFASGGRA